MIRKHKKSKLLSKLKLNYGNVSKENLLFSETYVHIYLLTYEFRIKKKKKIIIIITS